MILFLDDWLKFPYAKVHETTKNKSFLEIASKYRTMGVKNHVFPLALIDPRLEFIDPHDPDIDDHHIGLVVQECKLNPWYFMRECLMVPPQAGLEYSQFLANRGNIALWWLFFNHITTILIQIRQTGKSVTGDGLSVYLMNVRCNNTQINLLTKDDTLRAANIKRIKNMEDGLPFYLKQRTRLDANNTEMITVKTLNNTYLAHVPQASPKAALKVGRGLTSPIFFVDEAPFQPNIEISMPAALTAGTAARELAAKLHEPYGTIITTTAGKKDDRDGRYVYKMVEESAVWSERFLDCKNTEELEKVIRSNSPKGRLRVNATFNHIQLGKDDEWLKKAIEGAESITPDEANRDFFNLWTSGSQSSPLSTERLETIKKSQVAPVYDEISKVGGYVTHWFIEKHEIDNFMRNNFCIMTLDTSDAQGGDDMSLRLTSITSGKTIAVGTFNETNLITFGDFICSWVQRFENFVLLIERKSSGVAIIDLLLRALPAMGINPFKRIFNWVVNDSDENPAKAKEVLSEHISRVPVTLYKREFGFATSGSGVTSRSSLYSDTFQDAAKKIGHLVADLKTIHQICSLMIINGRVDHPPGEHDDCVITWLLTYWFMTKAKNLHHYGINSKDILKDLNKEKFAQMSTYDRFIEEEQQKIREEMDYVYECLRTETSDIASYQLENRLRFLNTKLILKETEIYSIDELINNLKDHKRKERHLPSRDMSSNYNQAITGYNGSYQPSYGGVTESKGQYSSYDRNLSRYASIL